MTVTVSGGSGAISYQWQQSATGTGAGLMLQELVQPLQHLLLPVQSREQHFYRVLVNAANSGCDQTVSNNATAVIAPDITITTQPTNMNECVGGNSTITVAISGGSGAITYQWQSSPTGTGSWSNATGTGATTTIYTPDSSVPGTTYYRVLINAANNGCDQAVSNVSTVVINPDLVITTQPDNLTECAGLNGTITVSTSGGSGTNSYQWQSSPDGSGSWTNVPGATSVTYTPPSGTPGTYYYRVIITNSGVGCDQVVSNAATVVIADTAVVTVSVNNPIVCIGGSSTISSVVTHGSGNYIYQWQSSPAGLNTWSNIASGGNGPNYNVPTSSAGTLDYRLLVTDVVYGCGTPVSNTVNVTVQPQATVTIAVNNNPVCIGGTSTITSTVTNGSGSFTYQWQSSPNGTNGWTNIVSGGNGPNYNVPTTTAGTTYYRIMVTDAANGCNDPVSDPLEITINNQPTVSIAVDNPDLCIGGIFTVTSTITNGSGLYNYQWQSSPNNTVWTNIATNGNSANYTFSPSTAGSTYYRVVVNDLSNGCNDPVSTSVLVVVHNQASVTIAVDNPNVCIGGSVLLTSSITNGSGLFNYQWQFSTNGGSSWSDATPNGTSSTYVAPTAVAGTTTYRLVLTDLGSGCVDPISNTVTVTVNPQPTVSIAVNNPIVCLGGSSTITSTITNGSGNYTYQWQQSPTGSGSWTNVASGGNGANYNAPTTATGTIYYRVLVNDISNGCDDPMSNTVSVTVANQPTVTVLADNPIVCINGSVTITSTISNGSGNYIYQWQQSPTGSGSWTNVASGGVSPNYNPPTTTPGVTYYRLLVTDISSGCNDPISNAVSVTVNNQPTVSVAVDNPIVCIGGTSTITSTITNGSGLFNYQWQSSPDGSGSWTNITVNGNSANYTTIGSAAGTTYYRVLVTDLANGCNDPMSNVVNIVVVQQPTVSVIVDNAVVCIGGSSTITSEILNGSGLYNYQWQSSPNGSSGWANIGVNGTSATYNVPTSVAGTTYYRLLLTDLANGCNDPMSNTVNVVVNAQPTVTIAADNPIVCIGGSSTISSTIQNGSGFYTYQWQISPDGSSSWTNITSGGNGPNYVVPTATPGTWYYRVMVT
jgi:hypothetical protein